MRDSDSCPARARGKVDGQELFVGDTVLVAGTVVNSVAGVGALVQFTSKTEDWQGWIREADLRFALVDNDLPIEPADGTWLLSYVDANARIFHRDDTKGHNDRDTRRYDRHWWDVVAQEWIDWPTAVSRGAAHSNARRMTVQDADE